MSVTVHTPLSRDIQAKIPLPQASWNFGYVTENGVNSNVTFIVSIPRHNSQQKFSGYYSAAQLYHSVNASSGTFHDIFRKEDFFPALSFQTIVDVH